MPRGAFVRPAPEFSAELVRDISEAVYRIDLGPDDVASMIAKDKDEGQKLRNRAKSYDSMTRLYLKVYQKGGFPGGSMGTSQ